MQSNKAAQLRRAGGAKGNPPLRSSRRRKGARPGTETGALGTMRQPYNLTTVLRWRLCHIGRNGMSVTLIVRWSGILLGILFIAAALSACGGQFDAR